MDPMAIAQLKRQMAWQAEQVKHGEMDLHSAELALEGAKKKAEELKKKIELDRRRLDQLKIEVTKAEEQARKEASNKRRG